MRDLWSIATVKPGENEIQQLKAFDAEREEILKKFVLLASQVLDIPAGFVSVLDEDSQYIKASHRFDLTVSSRQDALCRYVVESQAAVVIPDTSLDARFLRHPLVLGSPYIRFYAGVPLITPTGVAIGTLCVTDTEPHLFPGEKVATLTMLAQLVTAFLTAWHAAGFTDTLTGLPNHRRLVRDLLFLQQAQDDRLRRLIVIECLDLPRTFELARTLGIEPVSNLLQDLATLLPLRLRLSPGDLFYVLSAGRFALLASDTSRISAAWVAGRLEGITADVGEGLSVSLSPFSGETLFQAHIQPPADIISQALEAMREAVSLKIPALSFRDELRAQQKREMSLMSDLSAALRGGGGLYLVYQPKICLHTGKTVGLEALIRWKHAVHGELLPAAFLQLASQTNLLALLTEWVINESIAQLVKWKLTRYQLPVTVNISGQDFSRSGFVERLVDSMAKAGLPHHLLGVECLETEKVIECPQALKGIDALKSKGFSVALDDFGAGYSNINYLSRVPLDVIKLDRSLVSQIATDTAARIIARSIITMLKELNYVVIAEGVEDVQTLNELKRFGCDQAQGYFYSRPLKPEELEVWLQ
ncbi:GGDEF domain-containing protein [Candidatus Pantoea deserta]|uniref:GGDEF domain-containing protein n=1 Tax=Candidatus Pantoea deserta TaxID=1869313 RepID=A0A3N4NMS4_9GAMM|nr:GGDEF and EAL domain-containing protein [Pantoea deserta]RPD96855.1 GGDEF domain-containing protein [Pantoea deserta]